VTDTQDPTLTSTPSNITVNEKPDQDGAVVQFATPSATDNSGEVTVACVPASGSTFPVGTTTVTCTASDPSGNTASTSFTVPVIGDDLPVTGPSAMRPAALGMGLLTSGLVAVYWGTRRRWRWAAN
jgi:HYR domain-containing protein